MFELIQLPWASEKPTSTSATDLIRPSFRSVSSSSTTDVRMVCTEPDGRVVCRCDTIGKNESLPVSVSPAGGSVQVGTTPDAPVYVGVQPFPPALQPGFGVTVVRRVSGPQ